LKIAIRKFFHAETWREATKKLPSKKQLFSVFKIISKPERIIFFILVVAIIVSSFMWWRTSYIASTKVIPKAGGTIREALVGRPQNLNPLFSLLNDADKDISELMYSGLLKYDENGKLKTDVASKYRVIGGGKSYGFMLKDKLKWSDGEKITADDVIFTIETIQNPQTQSPLRIIFQGVTVKKLDAKNVNFTLTTPYPSFVENFTFKILPKHVFENVDPGKLSTIIPENLVSSGPFKVQKIQRQGERIQKVSLTRNNNYQKPAYISNYEFIFADNKTDLLKLQNSTNAIAEVPAKSKDKIKKSFKSYSLGSPRYFAIFLNQKKTLTSVKEVRRAMALATPKEKIIQKAFNGEARIVDTPFLKENNIKGSFTKYKFNLAAAKKLLRSNGWNDKNKDGAREKKVGNRVMSLKFVIYTVNQPDLELVARMIKASWKKIGIKVDIETATPQELLQSTIKDRDYAVLLFGHSLMMIPEPYSFWHSSQIKYPGLNLSSYSNSKVDDLLNKARKSQRSSDRNKNLAVVKQKITQDLPAVFLYSPNYIYALNKNIKGFNGKFIVDPSKRFINVENWYIKTERVANKVKKASNKPSEIKKVKEKSPKKETKKK
jgi:peptide/nickel transport system substrate-binding protein